MGSAVEDNYRKYPIVTVPYSPHMHSNCASSKSVNSLPPNFHRIPVGQYSIGNCNSLATRTVCVDLMRARDPVSSPFWNL